ncbi:coiled-coil domain-containing protein 51-like isoform X2 [Pseudomyrmex gracilis]|uniref:coiled-coil domain-containing protein 51-like isoform X2 n=1 Tax=Pseudomyrmex gracilis TaxID=219809 RepID=UPI0009950260|nr:coiled-coil domain-containing protein 51-like isoform X2 [Pseudomyrmex gracilis]
MSTNLAARQHVIGVLCNLFICDTYSLLYIMKTKHYQQLFNSISKQVKEYGVFHNAKEIVGSAAEKTQSRFSNVQNIANEKYNKINDQITITQDLNAKGLEQPLPGKIVKWWQWYSQLTGLNAVEAAKRQVVVIQDKLFECQDNRRTLNKELTDITQRLQEIYGELIQIKRDDPKYVNLTIMENKHLQEQKKIINQLVLTEKEERDYFVHLATAIKEYHDSQNLNAQKYKYLSIIASALVAIVSLMGSMILNNQRISDVRNTIKKTEKKNEYFFQANTNQLSEIKTMIASFNDKVLQQSVDATEAKANKKKDTSDSSNVLITSAKKSANLLLYSPIYVVKGIYGCGSYVVKLFHN